MFAARRQFASAIGAEEIDVVETTNKSDWWNCTIGSAKENSQDALRNGCNTGKSAARPVTIHLEPDAASEIWKYVTAEYEIPEDGGGIRGPWRRIRI